MNDQNSIDGSELIPFGRYKGQPVEVLAHDAEYRNWLLGQPWFRDRHGSIYAMVINHFGEPTETPEHNAMCARFFDAQFRLAIVRAAMRIVLHRAPWNPDVARCTVFANVGEPEFERDGWDVVFHVTLRAAAKGQAVELIGRDHVMFGVECKTSLGDDFPAVLRQVKNHSTAPHYRVAFASDYCGVGASLSEVRRMFLASHIALITDGELVETNVSSIAA
jgi:hypothetical protein